MLGSTHLLENERCLDFTLSFDLSSYYTDMTINLFSLMDLNFLVVIYTQTNSSQTCSYPAKNVYYKCHLCLGSEQHKQKHGKNRNGIFDSPKNEDTGCHK